MADPKKDPGKEPPEEKEEPTPPLDKKIPEPPGNLKRRVDWYRKRSE
jgi:hypothetical protein